MLIILLKQSVEMIILVGIKWYLFVYKEGMYDE